MAKTAPRTVAPPLVPFLLIATMTLLIDALVDLLIQFLAPTWAAADTFLWVALLGSALVVLPGVVMACFRLPDDGRTAVLAIGVSLQLLLVIPVGLLLPYLPTRLPLVLLVLTAALADPVGAVHPLDIARGVLFALVWLPLAPALACILALSASRRWPGDARQPQVDGASRWLTRWVLGTTLCLFLAPAALAHQLEREYLLANNVPLVAATLMYVSLGFCLIAWGNYTTLQHRWQQGPRLTEDRLSGSWLLLSMVTVGVITLLARLLPVSPVLNAPFPRRFFHDVKALLLGNPVPRPLLPAPPRPLLPVPPRPPNLPVSPEASQMNWQPVILVITVVMMVLLLVWLARLAKRTRFPSWLIDEAGVGRLLARLVHWVRHLSAVFRRVVEQATVASTQFLRRLQGRSGPAVVLYGDSPAERVRYWYGRLLTTARRAGYPRHPGQSVTDYQKVLEAELPDGHDPLARLTALYSEASYSGRPTVRSQEEAAQAEYDCLQEAIRARQRTPRSG